MVQVYLKSLNKRVVTRNKELRAFKKIWLKSGETQSFEIRLQANQLSEYDETLSYGLMQEVTVMVTTNNYTYEKTIKLNEEVS